jgi:hypothetical protein
MANADISHVDIEDTVNFGEPLSEAAARDIGDLCDEINSDVNIYLTRINFVMPITDSQSLDWIRLTKRMGATALAIDYLMGQASEEENTRAQRYWKRYQERISTLVSMGKNTLPGAAVETSPRPNSLPVVVDKGSDMALWNPMRFPQRAAVEQEVNRATIRKGKYARTASKF